MCRHISYMSNIYETTMIVKPDLSNDQVKNLSTSLEGFFNESNVTIGYKEDWGIKNLKFSINKYSKGSFKFIRFTADPSFPKKLDNFLKFNSDCLRFLITKSDNELEEPTPQINKDN